jgi:L-serine dehydratase
LSVLDLFTIGIGPSSSHTVGPMRAARRFIERLVRCRLARRTQQIEAHLYGSLALTGAGHGTDRAVVLGLLGEAPETVNVDEIGARLGEVRSRGRLLLGGGWEIEFDDATAVVFHRTERLPIHPNGLRFIARGERGKELLSCEYYSIGGGFVVEGEAAGRDRALRVGVTLPYPYRTGDDLLRMGRESGLSVSEMTLRNEACWRSEEATRAGLDRVWAAMQTSVERGCHTEGVLPGSLGVHRRAPGLYREMASHPETGLRDPLTVLDWVNLWAMAVNEENAAGGRVVTAPTNGAAGIVPAVLHYYVRVLGHGGEDGIARFLLTAGAVGLLYKRNASISGAEVGCQGEVGVACSMAAAALAEGLGGNVAQVENAAEIGMEHNLGLTCDPVGGQVQVPCIERNAMGAIKAINAARLALRGDGKHRVSLDRVIATMLQTGHDMSTKYKETSRAGLAVNVAEC